MPRYRILDQHGLNYITCTVVGWVDSRLRATTKLLLMSGWIPVWGNVRREGKGNCNEK